MSQVSTATRQPMADQRLQEPDCRDCGRPAGWSIAGTYWFADNALWNEVNGSPNGFLCPECFTLNAEEHGVPVGWRAGRVGGIEDLVPMSVAENLAAALSAIERKNKFTVQASIARKALAEFRAAYPAKEGSQE